MVSLPIEQKEFATYDFDRQLDIVSDAFEASWKRGDSPSVREYAKLVEARFQKRLLRELILIERECFDFFGDPPLADRVASIRNNKPSTDQGSLSADASDLPSHFDRFAITRLLGKGSHGIVYEAEDLQIRRRIAIKIAHNRGGDSHGNRAFASEAANASRVNHPSIVRVLDVGEFRGTHFMVSELIEGANLAEFTKSQHLDDCQCAHIAADIAAGVESAHQFGVIHRDLKPSNIMIEFVGNDLADEERASLPFSPDTFHVRILDFGIAKVADQTTKRTAAGDIVGTPHYMSPEQAAGDSANVDQRSDIFSLGVILFELLTGKLPFDGPELAVITGIRDLTAPSIRTFRPDVSEGLEKIVRKCLERKPCHRYQSAAELETDLRNWIAGKRLSFRRIHLHRWAFFSVILISAFAVGLRFRSESWERMDSTAEPAIKLISTSTSLTHRAERFKQLEDWIAYGDPRFLFDWIGSFDMDLMTHVAELKDSQLADLTEKESHRLRLAELCVSRGIDYEDSDAKLFAMELMVAEIGHENVWFQLLDRLSDRFVRGLESMLSQDWDSRKRRVLFGFLNRKYELSGDTEGLLRLLDFAQTEELSLIIPALIQASSDIDSQTRKSTMAELDNTELSPESGLGTDQSCRWRAKLGLVAYGLAEWERVDRVLSRATDPRSRSYFIYWFKQCGFSIEPLVQRFAEFDDEWQATAAIGCISNVHNQIVSESLRAQCTALLVNAYRSHPTVGVHNAARNLLVAMGHVDLVQQADGLDEFKQMQPDRDWYVNSSGMQMNIVSGPVDFWYGMPGKGKRPGKMHRIDHSFAIADRLITEKEFAEFDPATYPQPTNATATAADWFEAVRYCDWLNRREGLSGTESLESVDEAFQRYNVTETGYRLPSTWEWECFFRSGTRTSYRFGDSDPELFSFFRSTINTSEPEWTSTSYEAFEKKKDSDLLQLQDLLIVKGGLVSITNTILPLGENRLHRGDQKGRFGFRLSFTIPPSFPNTGTAE